MWKQRLLISKKHFKKSEKSAPIFFYAGNEGDIESFFENSGFVTDTLAREFKSAVIFAEHRFFGESYPGGSFHYADKPEIYKFLTTE